MKQIEKKNSLRNYENYFHEIKKAHILTSYRRKRKTIATTL